jgi:hypothetical protein
MGLFQDEVSELRSVVGAAAEPQTEARAHAPHYRCSLVTSALFAKRNRHGREGDRADR